MPQGWCRAFAATPDQAGAARRFLAAILGGHPAADDAVACLGELASNSIQHSQSARAGGTFTVRMRRAGAAIRVEVTDQAGPWRPASGRDDESGRGLVIVAALAAEWGVTTDGPDQRTVWFTTHPA